MPPPDPITYEQMRDLLREQATVIRQGGGFASGNMTGQRMSDQLWTGITNTGSALGKVSTGAYKLDDAIKNVTEVFGIFGGVGEKLGAVFGGTLTHVKEMNDAMIQSGRYGVTFSQNLFDYTGRLANAGISFDNFNKLLGGAGKQINGLGMNAQQSADFFLMNSAALLRSEKVMTAGLMGIGLTEFQDQLVITTDLFKNMDRTRIDVNRRIQESTIEATIEIDNMARITGRSRQEIQKDIDQQQQNRMLQIAKLSMTPDQLANLNKTQAFMSQLGPGFSDVYVQLMKFKNVVTPEGREFAGAMNMAIPGFMEKFQQMADSKDAKEQERLMTQLQYMLGEAMADTNRQNTLAILGTLQNNPVARQFTEIFAGKGANAITSYSQMYRESGGDPEKFRQLSEDSAQLRKAISENVLSLKQQGGAGAMISQMLLGLERAMQSGQTAVGTYIASFEKSAGKKLEGLDPKTLFREIMDLQNASPERLEAIAKSMINYTGVDTDNTPPDQRGGQDNPRYGSTATNPMHVNVVNPRLNVSADPKFTGSLGSNAPTKVSKWFEDFGAGTILEAHGRETVVREDQSLAFAMDTLRDSGILPNMAAGLRSVVSSTSGTDTGEIIRELSNVISTLPQQIKIPDIKLPAQFDDDNKILSEMLERLNTKMERLISAVEDGSKGTVKAVRSQNNLIG